MSNAAAVLYGPKDLRIEERPTPDPGHRDVLVRVVSVGVCGSDIHYYYDGRLGAWTIEAPLVLGHETAGIVVAVGAGVSRLAVGDAVALEPGVPCMHCGMCLSGRYNLCDDLVFFSHPPVDGTFTEFVTIDEAFAHPMPPGLSFDAAAMLEPFSVGMWSVSRARVRVGDAVLITGAGPIGLMAVRAARAAGAASVTVADVVPARLRVAERCGADATVDVSDSSVADGGQRFDAFVECSGSPNATASGVRALRKGGRAVLVGLGSQTETMMPTFEILARELEVTGGFRYANTWPTAMRMAAGGTVDLDSMVSAHFQLADCAAALEASHHDPEFLKAVVMPTGEP